MKYQKTFFCICGFIYLATLADLAIIILNIFKVLNYSSGILLTACFGFLCLVFLSLCCSFILQSIYDDWKSRRVNRSARWSK